MLDPARWSRLSTESACEPSPHGPRARLAQARRDGAAGAAPAQDAPGERHGCAGAGIAPDACARTLCAARARCGWGAWLGSSWPTSQSTS